MLLARFMSKGVRGNQAAQKGRAKPFRWDVHYDYERAADCYMLHAACPVQKFTFLITAREQTHTHTHRLPK